MSELSWLIAFLSAIALAATVTFWLRSTSSDPRCLIADVRALKGKAPDRGAAGTIEATMRTQAPANIRRWRHATGGNSRVEMALTTLGGLYPIIA